MNETINNQFKDIDASEWAQVLNLFDQLSVLSADLQAQRISTLDWSKPAKDILKKMLTAQHQPNMLDQTIDPLVEALLGEDAVNEHVNPSDIIGRTFGAWKAISTLGSGGMGHVFTAERADGQFEKLAALKVIKSGHFSELSQQRFLAEMRTLARFEHPHIAHLIDGGTSEDSITYFIMELVTGEPIVDYANAKQLPLSKRINLVLQVIDAVEYAHQNLIIHGDIKPANILVNQAGQVKLVDFGIARPLEGERSDSFLPQFTPSYSSPEQAQGKVLTTASDVFGLCAVLYELCTGSSPRNKESLTTHFEFSSKINKPITAALTNYQFNQSHSQQYSEHIKSNDFRQALTQELGAIIDKGLQIAVVNRYKNTTELRRDLLLFLGGSAVPTFATSWIYRWRKSINKYKWPVALSALALLSIIIAAMVAINQARLAKQEADKANWANQFLLSIFDAADPIKNQQNPITVDELTGMAAEKILADKSDLVLKTESLGLLGKIKSRLGDLDSAEQMYLQQIQIMENQNFDQQDLAQAYVYLAIINQTKDNLDAALTHLQKAADLAPLSDSVTPLSVEAVLSLSFLLKRLNKVEEAEKLNQSVLNVEQEVASFANADQLLAKLYTNKAEVAEFKGDYIAALKFIAITMGHAEKIRVDEPVNFASFLSIESEIYYQSGDAINAVKIDEQVLEIYVSNYGADHPESLRRKTNLAVAYSALGEMEKALGIYNDVMKIYRASNTTGQSIPVTLLNMATAHRVLGQFEMAMEKYQQAQKLWPNLQPRIPLYEAVTQIGIAQVQMHLGLYQESEINFTQALEQIEKAYKTGHPLLARSQIMYVEYLLKQNRIEETQKLLPGAYKIINDTYGEGSKYTAEAALRWAQLYAQQGDLKISKSMAKQAYAVLNNPSIRKRYLNEINQVEQLLDESIKKAH